MEENVTVQATGEVQRVIKKAKELARTADRPVTSVHLLTAMLIAKPNYCEPILAMNKVTLEGERGILDIAAAMKKENKVEHLDEASSLLPLLHQQASKFVAEHGQDVLNSLCYLLAICRMRHCLAHKVLEKAKLDIRRLSYSVLDRMNDAGRTGERRGEVRDKKPAAAKPAPAGPVLPLAPGKRMPAAAGAKLPAATGPGPAALSPAAPQQAAAGAAAAYSLSAEEFPLLSVITRNITLEAALGRIDPVIGRRKEIEQMIQILRKRRTNNPCLVGDPGVGKTALVEGLALEIVNGSPEAKWLAGRILLALETSSLVAGTQLRGSFSEKMIQLREEVRKAEGRVIIFIDEIHTIVGAGGGETALDAANELKTALARGEFPCIGATTPAEYDKYIEKDKALARRFKRVFVSEPTMDETREIAAGIIGFYEQHHRVKYTARAVDAAVRLSGRYVNDRAFPDKAIELLDSAGSRAFVAGRGEVIEDDVAHVLARDLGIPLERLLLHSDSRYKELEQFLHRHIVGHRLGLRSICEAVKRGIAGFSSARPLASLVFVGPPGVGKMQTSGALARFLFDRDDALISFQMSEFTEKHSIAKLIGTAPGYVGHEEGGRLTEAIARRPFRIILFRDVFSAHADVQEILAELIRTGTLTDGKGRRASFSNAVVVLSQDMEPELFGSGGERQRVGFAVHAALPAAGPDPDAVLKEMRRRCPSSLFDAADERVVFQPLSEEEVAAVARLEAAAASARLKEERNISFELTDAAVQYLVQSGGFTKRGGARLMKQTLARTVLSFLADRLLEHAIQSGDHIAVDCAGEKLTYHVG